MICIPILKDMDNSLILKVIRFVEKKLSRFRLNTVNLTCLNGYYKQIHKNKRGKSNAKEE